MTWREHVWWAMHNLVAHPLMTLSGYSSWADRLHDWTAERAAAAEVPR